MEQKKRIRELVSLLNEASAAYYGGGDEVMSNFQWDAYFDELSRLEEETGYVLPESPTQTTGTALSESAENNREPHEFPALSLAKTKSVEELKEWAGERKVWLSWKLDGLTLVLTYDGGTLRKVVTRGNGQTGNNITYMGKAIRGIPQTIKEKGHMVIRGEAVISYSDFEAVNDMLEDGDDKYANPRNLASGTLALDKTNIDKVSERRVTFYAFTLVYTERDILSWGDRMDLLESLGFTVVDREKTNRDGIAAAVEKFTRTVESGKFDLPVDGLVITYDDTEYAATGSVTGHHATRGGFAYKWQDTSAFSRLDHIEWSSAASTITPVAVFDPVKLEGTTVSRASLCNISELERLGIGADGETVLEVIKANKIIPKCISVKEARGTFTVPATCPVCHAPTETRLSAGGTKTLHCTSAACPAKHLKRYTRFVSKSGMDIDGLSGRTLLTFMDQGFISSFRDLYRLREHRDTIVELEGFGEKSADNLIAAIEKSRDVHPTALLYALCIPMIGLDAAGRIIDSLGFTAFKERLHSGADFDDIDGIGPERSRALTEWAKDERNRTLFEELLTELRVENAEPKKAADGLCSGLTFVITGNVYRFQNRDAFKAYVAAQGGKVSGSVSKKTDFLVNNDALSASAKNKAARELGIPILTEEEFLARFGDGTL